MEEKNGLNEEIVKRLEILINLGLEQVPTRSALSIRGKIWKLRDLGVSPSDIAKMLGKSTSYVTATLAQKRPKLNNGDGDGK